METYLTPWKKYATFSGRAPRKEYWTFYLINTAIMLLLSATFGGGLIYGAVSIRIEAVGLPATLFGLAVFIPTLAVLVRRLHDLGRTGWWVLLGFVPIIGGLILLIMLLFDSQPGPNQYGPNPKAPGA